MSARASATTAVSRAALGAALLAVASGFSATSGGRSGESCLPLLPARVELDGSPQLQTFAGPPGYGETPARDEIDSVVVLSLDSAITICADAGGRFSAAAHPETRATVVQLLRAPRAVLGRLGYPARVYGRLGYAELGPHFTEVVCYVDSIPTPGTERRRAAQWSAPLRPVPASRVVALQPPGAD